MESYELPVRTVDEVVRVIRALGQHRYVSSRLILVHAGLIDAVDGGSALDESKVWARRILSDPAIDPSSRDERLWRRATESELGAVLMGVWGAEGERARSHLRSWLTEHDLPISNAKPFDESAEDDAHPLVVDAGWELFPLSALDAEKHKGAIQSFGDDPIEFASARFEEESMMEPPIYLQELPAIGPVEVLRGVREGRLVEPFTLWTQGDARYHDYVLRGVARAAKLSV